MMKSIRFNFPMVSIILPCYNAEKVVSGAIESVAHSSIAAHCELIIVNDGSTDRTKNVIEAACKKICCPKIKVLYTRHQGVSKARNVALNAAEGKYIAFLDADDRISPSMLENMVTFSEKTGADFSYCKLTSDLSCLCSRITVPESTTKEKVFSTLLYRSSSLGFTSVLYRRETIERFALRFDESLRYGEDLSFLWKYAIQCSVFLFFHTPLYYYARDNKASAMHRVCWDMTDVLKAIEQIRTCIPQSEIALQKSYDMYMAPRYLLFLQKCFAAGNRRELFDKLKKQYPSISFHTVIKKARFIIQVSAILYCISPSIFFCLFRVWGKISSSQ